MASANQNVVDVLLGIEPKGLSNFNKALTQVSIDAMTTMSKRGAEKFLKEMKTTYGKLEKAQLESARVLHKLEKEALTDIQKRQLKHRHEMLQTDIKEIEKKAKLELAGAEKVAKRRKAHAERLAKSQERIGKVGEAGEQFGEEIAKAFSDMTSKDIGQMFKGPLTQMGTLTKKMGEGISKRAEPGGAMGGVGKVLATLGPALIALGAIAAGFAVLLKIISDADAQAKEFNRTLLDSGASAGELASGLGGITDNLQTIREAFTDFSFNRIWGTTAKDHLEILGAYAGAGQTFRELTQNIDDARGKMEALQKATATTLTYAKLFGQTNTEMAGNMGEYMEDLGHNFETLSESLSAVHVAARDSGFGVKRFYGMVLQATSGMSMYNVRLAEAAGLLTQMGKILGARMGGDFLQSLTKGFGDESMQDRHKRVMTTGGGKMEGIFERSAEATAESFLDKLKARGSKAETAESAKIIAQAIADVTGVEATRESMDKMVDSLGKLSPEKQAQVLAKARQSGDDEMVRQLTNLIQVSQGAQGGTGRMAMSLGGLDMGGKLAAMLGQASGVLGAPLYKMSERQLMAFEAMTGVQGEQLEQLRRIDQAMHGNWNELKDLQKKGLPYNEEEAKKQVEAYGAYVDEFGNIVSARLDEEGEIQSGDTFKDIGDYIQGQGDLLKETAQMGLGADTLLAQDVARNTTEMTKILEQGVEYWLERIHSGMTTIINFLGGGDERKTRDLVGNQIRAEIQEARTEKRGLEKKISDLETQKATESPEGRAKLDVEIGAAEKKISRLDTTIKGLGDQNRRLMQLGERGAFGKQRSAGELRTAIAGGSAAEEIKKTPLDLRLKGLAKIEAQMTGRTMRYFESRIEPLLRKQGIPEEDIARKKEAHISAGVQMGKEILLNLVSGKGDLEKPELERWTDVDGTMIPKPTMEGLWEEAQNAGADRIVDAIDKRAAEREIKEKERQKVLADADANYLTKGADKKRVQELVKAMKQADKDKLREQVKSYLSMTSLPNKKGIEKALMGEGSMPTGVQNFAPQLVRDLGNVPGIDPGAMGYLRSLADVEGAPGAGSANDMVMQIGSSGVKFAQRVDPGDVGVFSKKGGALAGAKGGKGGGVNVYHLYGEGPGVLNTITKSQQAGLLD